MRDTSTLIAILAFVMSGALALNWAHGMGIVLPPIEYRERLKDAAWVPNAAACVSLLVATLNSATSWTAALHAVACAVLAVGLCIPKTVATRSVQSSEHEKTPAARRASPRPTRQVSLRATLVGAGYVIGIVGWAVAIARG